jgi:PAS domain S-box-containing protein
VHGNLGNAKNKSGLQECGWQWRAEEKPTLKLGTRTAQFGLLTLCVVITILAYRAVDRVAWRDTERTFVTLTSDTVDSINTRFTAFRRHLDGLAGLFNASETVTRDDMVHYVDATIAADTSLHGLNGLGFIQQIGRPDLPAFLAEVESLGVTGFRVHPDAGTDTLYLVKYIEPVQLNPDVPGLDMASEDAYRTTLEEARDSGLARLSPPVPLEIDGKTRTAFIFVRPVFRTDVPVGTVDERRAALRGWAYAPIFVDAALANLTASQGELFTMSARAQADAAPYFPSVDAVQADAADALFGRRSALNLHGLPMVMEWASTEQLNDRYSQISAIVVLVGGTLLTGVFGYLLRTISRREEEVSRQVARKTSDLISSEEENRSIVENAVAGILTLDPHGYILSCNKATLTMLGRKEAEIVGRPAGQAFPGIELDEPMQRLSWRRSGSGRRRHFDVRASAWTSANGSRRTTLIIRDVTEEMRMIEEVENTERRWDLALRGAQIGVFNIDLSTGRSEVTDSWKRLMNLPVDEDGLDYQKIFQSRIHPDDADALAQADAACIRGETERAISQYRMHFEGEGWRWMMSNAAVVEMDGPDRGKYLIGAQTDVTDQVLVQEKIRENEERLRLVFSYAPVGNAVLLPDGRFSAVNDAFCEMLGFGEADLIENHKLRDILARDDLIDILKQIERVKQAGGHSVEAEREFTRRDGSRFWGLTSVSWTPDKQTQDDIYIVQVSDITEIKNLERMKSEFIATVSHELRTPLTSIRGALALLENALGDSLKGSGHRLLDIAQSNSDRLIALVNDILDMERIGSGQLEFHFESEDVAEFLEEVNHQMLPYADGLGIRLEFDIPDDTGAIWIDRTRAAQVFSNLISNACKFSQRDSVVRIEARAGDTMTTFRVIDSGRGIPDTFRANIFKPFSQADSTDTREKGGTGLGLSIVKQIVERMGGTVDYESVLGKGTTFLFTVPQEEPKAERRNDGMSMAVGQS